MSAVTSLREPPVRRVRLDTGKRNVLDAAAARGRITALADAQIARREAARRSGG